jgi:hypothetical protein
VKLSLETDSFDPSRPQSIADIEVNLAKTVMKNALTGRGIGAIDLKLLKYYLADPMGKFCGSLSRFDDNATERDGARGVGSLEDQTAALAAMKAALEEPGERAIHRPMKAG